MAFVAATMNDVKERLIALLNANPGVYSGLVATGGDTVGAFPSDAELTAACLEADNEVAVRGYFQSANDAMANHFGVQSAPLGDRDNVPFHHGTLNKVEVTKSVNSLTDASITLATDLITCPSAHNLNTGDLVSWLTISGALPTASPVLADGTTYYAIVISPTTLKIARTMALALAGTPIDLTAKPTGAYLLLGWMIGVEADKIDDITNATNVGETYVGAGAFDFLYKEDSGVIFTTATYCRLTYPEYTKTALLQCSENEKTLIIMEAASILAKNASPALFDYYKGISNEGFQQLIQDGVLTAQYSQQNLP